MEENNEIYREPRYTMKWLGLQSLYVLGIAFVLALIASGIDSFASGRVAGYFIRRGTRCFQTQSCIALQLSPLRPCR